MCDAEFAVEEIKEMSDPELNAVLRGKTGERFWSMALQSDQFRQLLQGIVERTGWAEARVPAQLAALYRRLSEHIHSHKFPRSDTAVLVVVGEQTTEAECRSLEAMACFFGVNVERLGAG